MSSLIIPAKILVIDDEVSIHRLLSQIFKKEIREKRYEFTFTKNVTEALTKIEQDCPDLLLADLQMPKEDGFSLLNQLHQRKINITTIIISGFASVDNLRRSLQEKAFDFVPKPFQIEELKDVVSKALNTQLKSAIINNNQSSSNSSNNNSNKVRSTTVLKLAKDLHPTQQYNVVCQLLERFNSEKIEDIQEQLYALSLLAKEEEEAKKIREFEDKEREAKGQIPLGLLEDSYLEERCQSYTTSNGEKKQYNYLFIRWRDPETKKLKGRALSKKDLQDPEVQEIVNRKLAERDQGEDFQLMTANSSSKTLVSSQPRTFKMYE